MKTTEAIGVITNYAGTGCVQQEKNKKRRFHMIFNNFYCKNNDNNISAFTIKKH